MQIRRGGKEKQNWLKSGKTIGQFTRRLQCVILLPVTTFSHKRNVLKHANISILLTVTLCSTAHTGRAFYCFSCKNSNGNVPQCYTIRILPMLFFSRCRSSLLTALDSSWNVMTHGDAREGKLRGNWRVEWVVSTLHNTSEHGVFSITTANAHTSAASSRLNWRLRRFKWTRPFRRKTKSGLCGCAIIFKLASITYWHGVSSWRFLCVRSSNYISAGHFSYKQSDYLFMQVCTLRPQREKHRCGAKSL